MIRLTTPYGRDVFVSPAAVTSVRDLRGPIARDGALALVVTTAGEEIAVAETADQVVEMVRSSR